MSLKLINQQSRLSFTDGFANMLVLHLSYPLFSGFQMEQTVQSQWQEYWNLLSYSCTIQPNPNPLNSTSQETRWLETRQKSPLLHTSVAATSPFFLQILTLLARTFIGPEPCQWCLSAGRPLKSFCTVLKTHPGPELRFHSLYLIMAFGLVSRLPRTLITPWCCQPPSSHPLSVSLMPLPS